LDLIRFICGPRYLLPSAARGTTNIPICWAESRGVKRHFGRTWKYARDTMQPTTADFGAFTKTTEDFRIYKMAEPGDHTWEDLVVAILSVNHYFLEKTY
jgi:hypothetical protein